MTSKVQLQVYEYLTRCGTQPTIKEISFAAGRSQSTIHQTLEQLRKKGFVIWDTARSRTIQLVRL
ncbi:LexA family protein [Sporomusa acidovorans]|uniref:LexA family protein n=1 Tax=Sporomusa acidovorans TaxID=112900 RepID=UPI000B85D150